MAAAITDLFQKLGGASSLVNTPKVTVVRAAAGATLTVDNCNWDQTTGKFFATYQVNTSGTVVAGTETIWKGIVTSSTSIGSLTRVAGAADTGNAIGDYVELLPTSGWANALVTGLLVEHNQDGTHGTVTADNLTVDGTTNLTGNLDVNDSSTAIRDSSDNELVKFVKTASAVNEVTVTNAATGNAPQISASGGDTNVDLRLTPKGTGNVKRGATGGSIDWWEEIGRTTLSVAGDTITVSSIPARKYLKVIVSTIPTGGTISVRLKINNDTGTNYANRYSTNGAADVTETSTAAGIVGPGAGTNMHYMEFGVMNIATQEKLFVGQTAQRGTTGAATAPDKFEYVGKWVNTTDLISRIDAINAGTGDYAIGSEVVVLGHD